MRVPLNVVVPLALKFNEAGPPVLLIVPLANVLLPVVESVFPSRSIVAVYPFTVIPATVGVISRLQLPRPLALKKAVLSASGTDAPPAPPLVFDQLAASFQLPGEEATQKRFWAFTLMVRLNNAAKQRSFKFFDLARLENGKSHCFRIKAQKL